AVVRDTTVLAERTGDPSRTHGERLPRELMSVLEDARVALHAIDRFAVSIGPGSFTGLRVGIATIQGLALPQAKPLVPVSTSEALAFSPAYLQPATSEPQAAASTTATWIDAHRGEVFAALYGPDGVELAAPTSVTPATTLDAWAPLLATAEGVRFVGD